MVSKVANTIAVASENAGRLQHKASAQAEDSGGSRGVS